MWTRFRAVLLALVLATGTMALGPGPAGAKPIEVHDSPKQDNNKNDPDEDDDGTPDEKDSGSGPVDIKGGLSVFDSEFRPEAPAASGGRAAIARPRAAVFQMINLTATLQPGEQTEGGLMTRTVWGGFKAPAAARIVIHTYGSTDYHTGLGSSFDSVLAVYRGTAIDNLVRITGNNNRPLPGIGKSYSLVQFDTVANAEYRVQIGSRAQAEGDISLNVFRFPVTGGLSAFMIQFSGNPFNSRDYVCEAFTTSTSIFCDAKFIVHNSTSQTLTVTPSTTLGTGVTGPAPFSLAPGALKVVNFTFDPPAFARTVRTVSGHFVFTGRAGGTVVTQARHRALVMVKPNTQVPDLIRAVVTPTMRTGHVNQPLTFTAKVTNTGSVAAIGCHFQSKLYSDLKTTFHRIDPLTGAQIGADNAPSTIPAGQSQTFKVNIASQVARDADYIDPEATAECANNLRTQQVLRGGFDITTSGFVAPLPSVEVQSSTPAGGVLNVPATGFAYYRLRTINRGSTKQLTALPIYYGEFDNPFAVSICRTNPATGVCLAPYAVQLVYTAAKNAVATFAVRVKAPAVAPAFDPDKRRVYVNFKLANPPYIRVGAPNIAVRKQ